MSKESTASHQFLTFCLGSEIFAVDVLQVKEILDLGNITRVPQMPEYMLGVINLRGSVVPVVDLRRKFGIASTAQHRDNCIVVLEVDFGGETTVVGALADAVQEVLDLQQDQIEPPPKMGLQLRTDFIRGMGKKDEQFVILLDIDQIFSSDELCALHDSSAPDAA